MVITSYGGTVEKFIGDAVMAVFGVPTVHEDDALRAVRAADQMLKRLDELNGELEVEFGIRLEMRIGINMGEVVAGRGSAAPNARDRGRRQPGQAARTGCSVRSDPHWQVDVPAREGRGEGRAASVLQGQREGRASLASSTPRCRSPRRRDHARLRSTADRSCATSSAALNIAFRRAEGERSCRLFTLLGVAGIGKSRLIAEFAAALNGRATILTGRCLPYGEGITFWPLRDIVRARAVRPAFVRRSPGRSMPTSSPERGARRRRRLAWIPLAVEETAWAFRRLLEVLARRATGRGRSGRHPLGVCNPARSRRIPPGLDSGRRSCSFAWHDRN